MPTAASCTAWRGPPPRPTTARSGTSCCTATRPRSGRTKAMSMQAVKPFSRRKRAHSGASCARPKGRPARSYRRRDQQDLRQGAGLGCASLPRYQASVRSCEDALSRVGQEPRAALRTWQLVPRAVAAADMRMNPSEIAISADRVGKTLHKLLKTGGKSLKSTFKPAHPNAPNR